MPCTAKWSRFFLALVCSLTFHAFAFAQAESPQPLAATKLGRLLRIPTIPISTETGEFIVALDTGSTGVALDPVLAQVFASGEARVPDQAGEIPLAFKLDIGKLSTKVTHATIFDMSAMREHLSQPVLGVVGMSVLREACLRCDFDKEQLSLLAKSTSLKGEPVELFFAEGGRPHVIMSIGRQSFPVMIDIGSELGLKVPGAVYDALEVPSIHTIATSMTSSGIRQNRGYKPASVKLGALQLENVLIEASDSEYGLAGLKFLCRMNLELDFPRKQFHCQPSKRFGAKDNDIRFGFSAATYYGSEAGVTECVAFIAKNSAAQMAGIRPGDLLVAASSEFYGEHKRDDLYRMLGLPRLGPTKLEVLRDGQTRRFTLE